VAPNLIFPDKTSRKMAESNVESILRCHEPCENRRTGAYFDHLSPNFKQRKTRWRREVDSNPGCHERFERSKRCPEMASVLEDLIAINSAEKIVAFCSGRFSIELT
jgi:hypothetical protein